MDSDKGKLQFLGVFIMREFMLGFFVASTLSLFAYIAWENYRHVPVVIERIPVPIQMTPRQAPDIETWET